MPDFNTELVKKMQNVRHFWQKGGAAQANPPYLLGTDAAPVGWITGANVPHNGTIDPIWLPEVDQPGEYRIGGMQRPPPDLPTWDLETMEYYQSVPSILSDLNCPITFYEVAGQCESLADIDRGWEGYVFIRADGRAQTTDMGGRGSGSDDTPLTDSTPFTGARAYPAGQLAFGEEAAAVVVQEVIDGVYLPTQSCGNCGLANDGTRYSYMVTRANVGSPSAAGQVVYTTDGWLTNATSSITNIGTTNAPAAIDVVGMRLFVLVPGGTQLFYASINRDTGVPGTWTAVATGSAYSDAYVRNAREVWLAGASGVGKATDIAVAPTLVDSVLAVSRIHGAGQSIVAVGANGAIRASRNGGVSWTTIPLVAGGVTITAGITGVAVLTERRWWVVTDAGNAYVTENGGATWTLVAFQLSGTGACRDIVFVSAEVGYILHDADSTAHLVCTFNGGATWANDGSRILNWPTFERGNRAVTPRANGPGTRSNTIAVAGLYGVGGDGVIQLGVAPYV
jgi:photosystem II stability/assembly factor-like uncharacterized protein